MNKKKTRVMIVDDQAIPRALFEQYVKHSDRYELEVSVPSAYALDIYLLQYKVDLILLDILMNDGSDGLNAAAKVKEKYPEIKIIAVTSLVDNSFLTRALAAHVDSFWFKEAGAMAILDVMDRTMAGESVYPDSPPVTSLGMAKSTELTDRELEVLRLLAEGLTDREIAERLYLGVTTVRYHVNNLIGKTGYSSRTELAVNAVRSGITTPGISG